MSNSEKTPPLPAVDAVRLLCAVWVGFSHMGGPPVDEALKMFGLTGAAQLLAMVLRGLFCGPAAVMVFFVISGFCIHYPFVRGQTFHWRGFLISRLTRITIPMLVAIGIFVAFHALAMLELILWSIYCEMLYYAAYPILRRAFDVGGVRKVLFASFLISAALMFFYPWQNGSEWKAPNHAITALLLAPGWILGCLLAEVQVSRSDSVAKDPISLSRLWLLRSLVLLSSVAAQALHFKSPVCYRYTMPLFSILVFAWLMVEFRNTRIPRWIVNAGKACYSIYLMHWLAEPITAFLLPHGDRMLQWTGRFLAAAVCATVFYWVIERPSHQFARRLRQL